MKRTTVIGRNLRQRKKEVEIKISTKVPEKWIFIDTEFAHVYTHNGNGWMELSDEQIKEVKKIMRTYKRRKN